MKDEKKSCGRVTEYTFEIAAEICGRLSDGQSLRTICKSDDMPARSTVFLWLRDNAEFEKQYIIAKDECADALVEDMLDIADNQVEQPLIVDGLPFQLNGEPVMVRDNVSVNHARLRVDTRKWVASKLKPKKYGDKVQQEVSGPEGRPIEHDHFIQFVGVNAD